MSRKGREHDARELSTRSNSPDQRSSMVLGNITTSNFPIEEIPEGMRYVKVAVEVRGNALPKNVSQMARLGYRLVPASRHPNWMKDDQILRELGLRAGQNDYIRDQEHVLMEIEEEKYQELLQAERTKVQEQTDFVSKVGNSGMHDPGTGYSIAVDKAHHTNLNVFSRPSFGA